jgi:DNA-binding XRE family transcriptional regulator
VAVSTRSISSSRPATGARQNRAELGEKYGRPEGRGGVLGTGRAAKRKLLRGEPAGVWKLGLMTRSQLRAARALLAWSREMVAAASGVSLATIKRIEPGEGTLSTKVETLEKLKTALEAAGVEFTNGNQPGVRMRNQSRNG